MSRVTAFAVQARKFLVALAGAIGVLVANGLLTDDVAQWVSGIVATLSAFVVYYVPNGDVEAKRTIDGETVAAEASPLPDGTPVKVVADGPGGTV